MTRKEASPDSGDTFFAVRTLLRLGVLLAFFAACALAAFSLVRSRAQYRKAAETSARNLCVVLGDNLASVYQKVDLALLAAKDEVEGQLASNHPDGARLESLLRNHRQRIPALVALRVVDAEGIVRHGDLPPESRRDLADRDYFIRLKSDPEAGLVISKPLLGRVVARWALMMARRINRPDGSFGGMVYGGLDLEWLHQYFGSLAIGREGALTLRDAEFTILVHRGGGANPAGRAEVSQAFRDLRASGHSEGTYEAASGVDGVARIHAYRRIDPYGQYLQVGLGRHEVFRPWWREFGQDLGFLVALLAILAASYWVVQRALARQREADAERDRVIEDLMQSLVEVRALRGLLPICSHCKKIRNDEGYWDQLETYICSHSDAQFTHGICPECAELLFPEVFEAQKPHSP